MALFPYDGAVPSIQSFQGRLQIKDVDAKN